MKKGFVITAVAAVATLTLGGLTAAPAMANPCRDHANPAACRARRQMRDFRRENRELRQELRFQHVVNGPGWGDYVHGPHFGEGRGHHHHHHF